MSFIQNLFTSRDNNAQGNTYVGQQDRIWWDPDTNAFYYSDGNTAGGIPIGTASGSGIPIGPINSVQLNAGSGNFLGTSSLTFSGNVLTVGGNVTADYFIGDGGLLSNISGANIVGAYSNANVAAYLPIYTGNLTANVISASGNVTGANVVTVGNVTGGNILSNNYLFANGNSIFANTTFTGNIDLGNLYITDQTIGGTNLNANIILLPEGDGYVTVPRIAIENLIIANVGGKIQFDTPANVDLQFDPGIGANILTAGTIKPTGNNIAGIGAADSRYTDLWLGAGNINLIDQTLSQNQQIYADNGNLTVANATGLSFGNFRFYGNTMALANAAANIEIGTANATGWVQFNRAIAVTETAGEVAFTVDKDGRTQIRAFDGTPANSAGALNIVASSDGNYQPVTNSGGMIHVTGPANSASRITVDAYGTQSGSGAPGVVVLRSARGNPTTPTATQANDITGRVSSLGWGTTFGPSIGGLAPTAMEFVALENYTDTAQGSKITFNTANIGANSRSVSATIQANGVSLLNNTVANSGITFKDGTFQNTAFSNTQVVTSATAATGIAVTPATTGNITITNTGVITVAGTANQIFVGGANVIAPANGVVQLSLPQDIAASSNPTFNTLTVNNLIILGNVSNVIPSVVGGPIIYVANTATSFAEINNSGLVTGNAANSVYAGILYQTGGLYANTWDMTIGNSVGIYAGNLYAEEGQIVNKLHVGFGNADPLKTYPDASIQADCDTDSYNQIVIQNHNQGANASADFVAVANNGDDGNFYIDMGINSNVYNNSDYALMGPNDGYLYVNGGNLNIGTQTPNKIIEFFTGGTNSTTFIRGVVSDSGLSMVGNVTANNFIGNSLATTNGISATGTVTGGNIVSLNTVSAAGNITGQNLLTTGIVSATANVTGGNIRTTGLISATGNITGGNLITATTVIDGGVSTSGNVTGANILTGGTVSATGNINGANIIANLAIISSTLSILGNIQGGNLLTAGVISTTGNATFGNVQTTGRISITGNVDAGNVRTAGIVTATGNVSTAGFFVGDGGFISNLAPGTKIVNGTSYANIAAAGGNLVIAVGGNTIETITTTGSNITGYANVTGNVTGGNISSTGNISDANGLLRSLPINNQVAAYTLTANDNGNLISITTGNVTVPAGVFASPFGQAITVYNNSAVTRFITQGANVTLRLAGTAATGNRTLTQRGLATIVCVSANTFVVSGVGLS